MAGPERHGRWRPCFEPEPEECLSFERQHLWQGVPLRIELGPRDMEGGVAMLARRDNGGKQSCAWGELAAAVPQLLEQIQVGTGCCSPCWCVLVMGCCRTQRCFGREPKPVQSSTVQLSPSLLLPCHLLPCAGGHVRQGARRV